MEEKSRVTTIRQAIVGIVAFTVLFLGYPLLKSTTTIYRADLPREEIKHIGDHLIQNVHFRIPIYIDVPHALEHFIPAAQSSLDATLYSKYPQLKQFWALNLKRRTADIDSDDNYVVKIEYEDLQVDPGAAESFYISPFSKETKLVVTSATVNALKVNEFLTMVLLEHVFGTEIKEMVKLVEGTSSAKRENDVVMPYSPHYNIVFSLLVENGKSVEWEIEESIKLLEPALQKLSHFSNFSISTQIQYYSKLTSQPKPNDDNTELILSADSLSTFINFGDWNLITHDLSPTINFLVYFPESNYNSVPVHIENSVIDSFIVPKWGGVKIFNKDAAHVSSVKISESELLPVMEGFTSQLFKLLGFHESPKSPSIRIDILSRIRFLKNIQQSLDSLNSLIKLTESLSEISVPELTKNHVHQAVSLINQAVASLNSAQDYKSAMKLSSQSAQYADKAFFEKEMVQQAYFPSEHKLAVFLPLLGPIGSIVVLGVIKLISDIKKEKKAKAKKE